MLGKYIPGGTCTLRIYPGKLYVSHTILSTTFLQLCTRVVCEGKADLLLALLEFYCVHMHT